MNYNDLEPKNVFKYFKEISQIPRGTGDEKAISDYLVEFGKKHNFYTIQDENLNVYMRKPASKGYENSEGVILQAHMDMVNEKTIDSNHDFLKDPIELIIEGDIIHADKTTLGADNGIGLAIALTIFDDDSLEHPPLELLVTTGEEVNMNGALNFDITLLKGEHFINIDSEEENIMTVGSAGGELYMAYYTPKLVDLPNDYETYNFVFSGFLGGHSGGEIDKNKGNMIKVMADFVNSIEDSILVDFNCGTKDNSIPSYGALTLSVKIGTNVDSTIEKMYDKYKNIEGELLIELSKVDNSQKAQSVDDTKSFVNLLLALPTGVNSYMDNEKNIIESSSNLAIIKKLDNGDYEIWDSLRSSNKSMLEELKGKFIEISKDYPVKYNFINYYPEWEYKENSKLRDLALNLYKKLNGKDMTIEITHGGLECGVFYEKNKNIDMISIGPNIYNAHTPEEAVSISSLGRFYKYLLELLKELK